MTRARGRPSHRLIRAGSALHRGLLRLTGGRVTGRVAGLPVILLTTTGARTGQARTRPLLAMPDDPGWLVVASNAGHDTHPAWYLNLRADPAATVQVGRRKVAVVARDLERDAAVAAFERFVGAYPSYADYRAATTRTIPVVRLDPRSVGSRPADEGALPG